MILFILRRFSMIQVLRVDAGGTQQVRTTFLDAQDGSCINRIQLHVSFNADH